MYYLEVDLDMCNGCGVCTSVCPHNSSFDVMTRGGKGFVTSKVLIGVKGGSSTVLGEHVVSEYCGECVLNCPQHAIEGEDKEPHAIVRDKCIKCGICYDVCKFDAILRKGGRA